MQLAGGRDVCVVASCRYLFVDIYICDVQGMCQAFPGLDDYFCAKSNLSICKHVKIYIHFNILPPIFNSSFDVYGRPDFIFSLTAATSLVPVLAVDNVVWRLRSCGVCDECNREPPPLGQQR